MIPLSFTAIVLLLILTMLVGLLSLSLLAARLI